MSGIPVALGESHSLFILSGQLGSDKALGDDRNDEDPICNKTASHNEYSAKIFVVHYSILLSSRIPAQKCPVVTFDLIDMSLKLVLSYGVKYKHFIRKSVVD